MASAVFRPSSSLPVKHAGELSAEARGYALQASAENTRRAYRAAWQDFVAWSEEAGTPSLPSSPEAVGSFLAARAAGSGDASGKPGLKVSSLSLRVVAITQAHRLAGFRLDTGHPAIRETLKGIRRKHGTAANKKDAAVSTVIRDAVDGLSKIPGFRAQRDRALLLVGFAAALRRSELVALDVADVAFVIEGAVLTIRRAKTDQDGKGVEIAIPFGASDRTCPVKALAAWLSTAGITEGAIFRAVSRHSSIGSRLSDKDVARVVKASVEAAGYDAAAFSGHSLRSGFITSAARAGVPEAHIQNQSRHRSLPVLRGYIRRGSLFVDNAAAKVGL